MFCGTNSTPYNIPNIFPTFTLNVENIREYFVENYESHITPLWMWKCYT